ncbi:hypothetical protein CASFOL_007719 [Castilleja foliolosa]|uniref:Chloroplast envelope membrane protein n=1 Tax=Castilleja foliolosa TaxID=1961234 RepID=A0ABD3E5D6_9LAMI
MILTKIHFWGATKICILKSYPRGLHTFLHFSTNIICFIILSGYSIFGNEELVILNSWAQEFLSNLSDTVKAFLILLLTDLCIGFHSPHGWELMIGSVYKDFGFIHNDQIISGLVSTFPVILDTIFKFCNGNWNDINSYLFIIYVTPDLFLLISIFLPILGIGMYPDFLLSLSVEKVEVILSNSFYR